MAEMATANDTGKEIGIETTVPLRQLGQNCRAMVIGSKLEARRLDSVNLETLSHEAIIGLMGVSLL